MVFATTNLQLLLRWKEPTNLLQRLSRYDKVIRRCTTIRRNRNIHLGQAMAVRSHHAHPVRSQLPQHAIEDRPAFFRGNRERRMGDQFLEISRFNPPAFIETDGRKSRKLIPRQTKQLES